MTLEQDCLSVLTKQMGPAAKVFLNRQCRNHLKKEASELQKEDLPELAKLCFIGTQPALGVVAAESLKKGIIALE
ncbi:MAG: hypothetical protein ABSG33_09995 [Candidatus Bathyarchaeia archaeon]|jgi:hypothetical protein